MCAVASNKDGMWDLSLALAWVEPQPYPTQSYMFEANSNQVIDYKSTVIDCLCICEPWNVQNVAESYFRMRPKKKHRKHGI